MCGTWPRWVGEAGPAWGMLLQVSSRRGRWTRFRQVQQMAGGCAVGYGAALRDLGTALEQICGLPSMGDHRAHPPPHTPISPSPRCPCSLSPAGRDPGNLPLFPQSQPPAWFPGRFRKWPYPPLLVQHGQLRSQSERSQETTEGEPRPRGSRGSPKRQRQTWSSPAPCQG